MNNSFRFLSGITPLILLGGVMLVPAGCGPQAVVESYTAPKSGDPRRGQPAGASEYRMLGAMIPAENPQWYVKFSGPVDEIAKYEAGFDELLKSVKIGGAADLEFTPPNGWVKGPGRGVVSATAKPTDSNRDVTFTKSEGGVDMNLNRWIGQIGLKPSGNALKEYTTTIEIAGGVKALRVDLRGPNNPETKRGPMMPPGHP